MDSLLLLTDIIPTIPTQWPDIAIVTAGILGIVLLVYAIFIEQEHRQDLIRIVGACGLLIYALYIGSGLFVIAMAAIAIASAVEFFEIMFGLHTHSPEDLKRYKKMWRIKKKK